MSPIVINLRRDVHVDDMRSGGGSSKIKAVLNRVQ